MQCWSTIQQDRVSFKYIFKNIPNNCFFPVHELACRFHRFNYASFDQLADDKWFEKFSSHVLRQAALMQFEFRSDHNDRTARIIYTFPKQVLAKTPLFTFQDIAERFECPASFRLDCIRLSGVIKKAVNSFLKHSFLVP